jgi:parvulin-like peptidyl-prolyl isomerase
MRRGPLSRHFPPAGHAEPPDVRRLVARQLATEELLRQEAERAGIVQARRQRRDPSSSAGELARIAPLLLDKVTADVRITESDVRAYYERNLDRYRVRAGLRVRHILVADAETAEQLRRRLQRGARFASLARRWSIDPWSRATGGELGVVRRGELAGPLEEALFAAPPRSLVGPIKTEHGWHLARVDERVDEGHEPYEVVRDAIRAELLAAARERAFGEWLEERRAAVAVMAAGFGHPADPVDGIPTHRH